MDNSFIFYKNGVLESEEIKWKSNNRKCTAKVYSVDDDKISRGDGYHDHPRYSDKDIERFQISTQMKRKAEKDISLRLSKLFHSVAAADIKTVKKKKQLQIMKEDSTYFAKKCKWRV